MHSPISRRAFAIGAALCALTFAVAACGSIVIASIDNGLGLLGLGSGEKFVITGGVLLLAVSVDSISRRGRESAGRA
jgi:ABC-type xylose transport system permease subunit